jgi:hypothetical protein
LSAPGQNDTNCRSGIEILGSFVFCREIRSNLRGVFANQKDQTLPESWHAALKLLLTALGLTERLRSTEMPACFRSLG